jgi:hypothetical protein
MWLAGTSITNRTDAGRIILHRAIIEALEMGWETFSPIIEDLLKILVRVSVLKNGERQG